MASRPPNPLVLALLGRKIDPRFLNPNYSDVTIPPPQPKTTAEAWRNAKAAPAYLRDNEDNAKARRNAAIKEAIARKYAIDQANVNNPLAAFGLDITPEGLDPNYIESFNDAIDKQGGWGLSSETRKWLGADDSPRGQDGVTGYLRDVKRPVQNLVANAADLAFRGYQGAMGGLDAAMVELDKNLVDTGAATLTDPIFGYKNSLSPGQAVMSLMEAFPEGGLSHGITGPMANRIPKSPITETVDELAGSSSPSATITPNPRDVAEWWADKNGKVDKTPVVDDATGAIVGDVPAEKVAPSVDGKRRPYTFASETGLGKPKLPEEPAPVLTANDNGPGGPSVVPQAAEPPVPMLSPDLSVPGERPLPPAANENNPITADEFINSVLEDKPLGASPTPAEPVVNSEAPKAPVEEPVLSEPTPEPTEPAPAEPSGDGGREPPPPINTEELVGRLTDALKGARKLLPEQAQMYTEARQAKLQDVIAARATTSGEAGLAAELDALKGELPKKSFEDVKDQFTQPEIEHLFNVIKEAPQLGLYTSITARKALGKLLEGQLPTKSEIALLQRVLPKEFIDAALSNRSNISKVLDATGEAINVPRALMASFDLSAPFRQGLFLTGRKEFWKAWGTMFKSFGSERAYKAVMDDIRGRPNADLYDQAGLSLSDAGHIMGEREEAFMSNWAEKIPIIGRGVRASDRAYTAFLNKVRADTFDTIVDLSRKEGIDVNAGGKPLTDIAKFVNAATGRGSLGKAASAAPALNALFFSPRLIASRVQLLNPAFYVGLSPVVRREAIKSLITTGTLATTVLGMAAAAGLDVEADPRSSDFGKIKSGNTRFDVLGGFGQYITLGARLATNQTKGINGGDVQTLGTKYGQATRLDTLGRFARSKLSPVAGFVGDYLAGKDYTGQPFDVRSETAKMFVPLLLQDVAQTMKENGPVKGAAMAVPGVFGVGVNTYNSIPPAPSSLRWNGQDLPLDRQAQSDYQEKVQAYYDQNIQKLKNDGDWDKFSKNDQNVMTKAIIKEGKKLAKDSMLPNDPTPTITPGETMFDGFSGIPQSVRRTVKGNEKVGGVANSDHLKGDAVDFTPQPGQSMSELEQEARKYFPGTYILNEGDHVHVRIPGLNGPLYGKRGTVK